MKSILEFSLPDDQEEFETAANAQKYRYVLSEFDSMLRRKIKYPAVDEPQVVLDSYEALRSLLHTLLKDENISL